MDRPINRGPLPPFPPGFATRTTNIEIRGDLMEKLVKMSVAGGQPIGFYLNLILENFFAMGVALHNMLSATGAIGELLEGGAPGTPAIEDPPPGAPDLEVPESAEDRLRALRAEVGMIHHALTKEDPKP